ncbi:MAG: hypothetical protein HY438_02880 [DPANN group archaeon]|nr:hypothetical protein [DPANN group archaeon]
MGQANVQKALAGLEVPTPEKSIKVMRSETLEETVRRLSEAYERFLQMDIHDVFENGYYLGKVREFDALNITPQAIFEFVARLSSPDEEADFPQRTGNFISAMIQRSYDAGHNNFEIYAENLDSSERIFSEIVGSTQRRIKLKATGDFLGVGCFHRLKNVDAKVIGSVGESAFSSAYLSNFEISGSVGVSSAQLGRYSSYKLLGDVCGKNFGVSTTDSIIMHRSEIILDAIRKQKYAGKYNKYYLLKDGREIPYTTAYRLKQRVKSII